MVTLTQRRITFFLLNVNEKGAKDASYDEAPFLL